MASRNWDGSLPARCSRDDVDGWESDLCHGSGRHRQHVVHWRFGPTIWESPTYRCGLIGPEREVTALAVLVTTSWCPACWFRAELPSVVAGVWSG